MKKAIIFTRVSSDRQHLEEQESRTSALAAYEGYPPEQQILISFKESAIKLSEEARMGISDLKEYITKDSEIDAVYGFEISRLARSQKTLFNLRDFLLERHIQLRIVEPDIHMMNPDGSLNEMANMAFSMYAMMAEQEMRLKKERFRNGRERNRKLGRFNGGHIPLGFRLNEENILVPKEDSVHLLIGLFTRYRDGWSIVRLRQWLDSLGIHYSAQNIKLMLSRESLRAVVGDEAFDECQKVKKSRYKERKYRKFSLCEGLIECPECGRAYTIRSNHVYNCVYHDCQRKGTDLYCHNSVGLSARRMDAIVLTTASLWKSLDLVEDAEELRKDNEKKRVLLPIKIQALSEKIEKCAERKSRVAENYEEGIINRVKRDDKLSKIRSDEMRMQIELSRLQNELSRLSGEARSPIITQAEFLESVSNMSQEEKYWLVHEAINSIELEISGEYKTVTIYSSNSERTAKFRFYGQARHFRLIQLIDDAEIDVTNVDGYK